MEKIFYNALTIRFQGDYKKLDGAFTKYGDWKTAYLKTGSLASAEAAWKTLEKSGISLTLRNDADFPESLRHIPWEPHALYYKGKLPKPGVALAIVGTRKATEQGIETARQFAQDISKAGVTVISGLALGIDAASHEGALKTGTPTIAVLACGLDQVYPRQHVRLAEDILKHGGALISEYPIGSLALPRFFIERNRIVSGLSNGVLVIEMPARSGAKATARFAVEQDKDVFVVPGPLRHANYTGSHELIKSGATLVTDPAEVLQHLGVKSKELDEKIKTGIFDKLDKNQRIIIETLRKTGHALHSEELAQRSKLSIPVLNEALTMLIIEGILTEENGAYYLN